MYYKKKDLIKVTIFLSLIFLFSFYLYSKLKRDNYIYSSYEQELVNYFKEVALKTEYGNNPQKIIKWKKVMYLYPMLHNELVKEGQCIEQLAILKKTINTINTLINNNFRIILTDDIKKSNCLMYITNEERMKEIEPNFFVDIDEKVAGLTKGFWNSYYLYRTKIFIDIDQSLEVQKSAIIEEVTQSIGLPNDSEKYTNSVFYQKKSQENINITEYSSFDKDVIQLLYHPNILAGMNEEQVEEEILKILNDKEIRLYGEPNTIKNHI
jgi:hypothetical protein